MGMYTEFHFFGELRRDAPAQVVAVMQYLLNDVGDESAAEGLEHPFFECDRWHFIGGGSSCGTLTLSKLSGCEFAINCSLKNYNGEIEKFVDWVMPYLDNYNGEFLGYSRYEDWDDREFDAARQCEFFYYRER